MDTLKMHVREAAYWRLRRPAHKAFLALVWRLPEKVVYWCVIRAAVKVESNESPAGVTAEQMLKALEGKN
jgi:hypothetical protein